MNSLSRVVLALLIPFAMASAQEPKDLSEIRAILHEASHLIPQIEELQQPSIASNIGLEQMKVGDMAGALESASSASKKYDGSAFYGIVCILSGRGDWKAALELLDGLPASSRPSSDYLGIIIQLAKRGDFAHAREVAEKFRQSAETSPRFTDALLRISAEEWKAGEQTASLATLREALEAEEQLEAPSDRAAGYANMASTVAALGTKEEAAIVVEGLRNAVDQEREPAARAADFGLLAKSLAAIGNIDEALATARQMPRGGLRDSTMIEIASQQAQQGDPDGARVLASGIPKELWSDFRLIQFASALASAGDANGAIAAIRSMPKAPARANGFAQVALAQAGKKDPVAMLTVTLAMEEALRERNADDHYVFELIAVTRAEIGDFPGAMQILDGLEENARQWPLWSITELLVAAHKKNEALALARDEKAPKPRAYALLGVATAMREQLDSAKTKSSASK